MIFSTSESNDVQVLISDWNGTPAGFTNGGWPAYLNFITNKINSISDEESLLYSVTYHRPSHAASNYPLIISLLSKDPKKVTRS